MKDEQPLPREITAPDIARGHYRLLQRAPLPELQTTIDWFQTGQANLSLDDCAQSLTTFAQQRGTSVNNPTALLRALFALEALRANLGVSPLVLLQFLDSETRSTSGTSGASALSGSEIAATPAPDPVRDLLLRFFGFSDRLDVLAKAQQLYEGVIANYETCRSAVEFRPIYNQTRDAFADGLIAATLIVQVREVLTYQDTDKLQFQVDIADIDELVEELDRLRKKIRTLKIFAEEHKIRLLNPSKGISSSNDPQPLPVS